MLDILQGLIMFNIVCILLLTLFVGLLFIALKVLEYVAFSLNLPMEEEDID
jgi:heme/copper-type cytochrome/quinol oxidase subunit 3